MNIWARFYVHVINEIISRPRNAERVHINKMTLFFRPIRRSIANARLPNYRRYHRDAAFS